jgi:hypothetical protein
MRTLVERLSAKPWSELIGGITGMGAATTAVLLDVSRSRSYDPALCATAGGRYCDEPLLPPALGWALVAFGVTVLLLVVVAMGLKLWRGVQGSNRGAGAGT